MMIMRCERINLVCPYVYIWHLAALLTGQLPCFEVDGVCLWESNAIARYVARELGRYMLMIIIFCMPYP